jgi:hypothetical protein
MYSWDAKSTYIQEPPFFVEMKKEAGTITSVVGARCLAKLGDSVTTDHISPAGDIKKDGPAGKFLVEHGGRRVLFDAGLFQGLKELRERNWATFPVPPDTLDAVVVSHAHLDHCGYLPRLAKAGFRGDVHVTFDTGRLMSVVLPDSARLQEEEARYAASSATQKRYPGINPDGTAATETAVWPAAVVICTSLTFAPPVSEASARMPTGAPVIARWSTIAPLRSVIALPELVSKGYAVLVPVAKNC